MRLLRGLGMLLAFPFMPFLWCLAVFRALRGTGVQTSAKPSADSADPSWSLAYHALEVLQDERASRGLDPLDLHRAEVHFGNRFDRVHITFSAPTLAENESQCLSNMAAIGAFELTPRIRQEIAEAQARARLRLRERY